LVLRWRDAEAALEVAVQVALVGESGGGRGVRDGCTGFEQATGDPDAVGDLQCVRWKADVLMEQPDEPELADSGGSG
jgi:hypothetical protein